MIVLLAGIEELNRNNKRKEWIKIETYERNCYNCGNGFCFKLSIADGPSYRRECVDSNFKNWQPRQETQINKMDTDENNCYNCGNDFCFALPITDWLSLKQECVDSDFTKNWKPRQEVRLRVDDPIIIKNATNDPINPDYYKNSKIECIDALAAATEGLTGIEAIDTAMALKYLWRWKKKNGVEDLKKAHWYIDHLIKALSENEVTE